jgi:hypothetical protein
MRRLWEIGGGALRLLPQSVHLAPSVTRSRA